MWREKLRKELTPLKNLGYNFSTVKRKGFKMSIQDSKYQVWCSANAKEEFCERVMEVEFFLVASDDLKEARRYCRKQLNYPGITAAWVIRSRDGEVVQPHEKF